MKPALPLVCVALKGLRRANGPMTRGEETKMTSRISTLLWILALVGITALVAGAIQGTTVPESYPLREARQEPQHVDPGLAAWIDKHSEQDEVISTGQEEFQLFAQKQDAVTAAYLRLARAQHQGKQTDIDAAVAKAMTIVDEPDPDRRSESRAHHLMPFLFHELSKVDKLPPEADAKIGAGLAASASGSCVEKKVLFEEIEKEQLAGLSNQEFEALLQQITGYRSREFQRNALRKIIRELPSKQRKQRVAALVKALRRFPGIIRQEKWLRKGASDLALTELAEPYKGFYQAKDSSRRRRCSTAKGHFVRGLAAVQKKDSLHEAVEVGRAIGTCYRRRGSKARRGFWQKIQDPLHQAYGFPGWAEAQLRIGYLHWTADEFSQAKKRFDAAIVEAKAQSNLEIEGRSIYALARIAENQAEYDLAIKHYSDFVARFPLQENADKALMALTLLRLDKEDWRGAGVALEKMIAAQDKMPIDDRSISTMAFALFWSGKVQLALGQGAVAEERWRRLASEYFSTFYGAMGHFMLENLVGKKLALQPSRTMRFRMHKMRKKFAPEDRQKIKRTETLLEIGQQRDALCEANELDLGADDPDRVAVRALLLSAMGEWLEAIKTFDSLPRSFRQSLPAGFERLLFPVRYGETIASYASRAGVDADLVKAIIRQESVFNPSAHSPAGARGLMQLMPRTARLEASRLRKSYLPAKERRSLKNKSKRKKNLFNPTTNVAIGVHHVDHLLKRYKSPVYALSAYNASPKAAERWMKSLPSKSLMSFIERIPYNETRSYVKLVLRNYFYYKRWYASPKGQLEHLDQVTSSLLAMVKANAEEEP